jgi:hypothetical protein
MSGKKTNTTRFEAGFLVFLLVLLDGFFLLPTVLSHYCTYIQSVSV